MPSWLPLLSLFTLCCTLLAPLFVLAMTGGNWRLALRAWWQYSAWLAALALPGLIAGAWLMVFPP